jgi:NAD(P)H-dependent flavin oxidoreductase YrpB (nitropropane dioxygenase family)
VSNARGLGSYGANDLAPDDIMKVAAEIRQLTDKPFGRFYAASRFSLIRIAVRAALFS